ncbi:hypothetical protein B834_48 [Enterococcus mundtii 1A]|nr:hypothetical protein [Enterococcus mundtii 1A]
MFSEKIVYTYFNNLFYFSEKRNILSPVFNQGKESFTSHPR